MPPRIGGGVRDWGWATSAISYKPQINIRTVLMYQESPMGSGEVKLAAREERTRGEAHNW